MKLFYFALHERNDGQEYTYDHVVRAENIAIALKKADAYARNFYDDADVEKDETEVYWFFGSSIAVEFDDLHETTKKDFLKRMYNQALIG